MRVLLTPAHTCATNRTDGRRSMARLGVSYVDIVICHDIEFGDLDQIINETIPALKLLKEQGRLGFIGTANECRYLSAAL